MRFTKTYDTNQGACSPRPVICLRQMKDFIWFCGGICAGNVLFFLKNVTSRQNCTRHPTERGEIQQKPTIQPNRQSTAILDWWTVFFLLLLPWPSNVYKTRHTRIYYLSDTINRWKNSANTSQIDDICRFHLGKHENKYNINRRGNKYTHERWKSENPRERCTLLLVERIDNDDDDDDVYPFSWNSLRFHSTVSTQHAKQSGHSNQVRSG